MTISLKEMLEIPGAQYVGGNVIVGILADRKTIATTVDDVFGLTDEGREYFKQIQEDADNETVASGVKAAKVKKTKEAKPTVAPTIDETPVDSVQSTDSAE